MNYNATTTDIYISIYIQGKVIPLSLNLIPFQTQFTKLFQK